VSVFPLAAFRRPAFVVLAAMAAACRDPSPTTTTLIVTVNGLPAGAIGSVRVTGPDQFLQVISTTITLENLVPGRYILSSDTVLFEGNRYGVTSGVDTITLGRGRIESVAVPYGLASGGLTITPNGLPAGTIAPALHVRGPLPNGSEISDIEPGTPTTGMIPGKYEIMSDTATTASGDLFAAAKVRDTVVVPASLTPVQASVAYALASGNLALTVQGLPSGTLQPIVVHGPGGFEVRTGESLMIRGLVPGTYTVVSPNVGSACPKVFSASNSAASLQQNVDIQIGETDAVTSRYSEVTAPAGWLNLRIEKVYLTQATQNSLGTVPLISGKTALLRVFGVASQCNTARPSVRVTLSTGLQVTLPAPEDSVRVAPLENSLGYSWNVVVPASDVRPGMTVVAEMDVTGAVAEASETDNRFPLSGSKRIDVRAAPVVGLRFVPIVQTVNGVVLKGNVDSAALIDFSRRIHPVGSYNLDIREPYTTTKVLQSSGTNWTDVLSEIQALRQADNAAVPTVRHYYGVAKLSYSSGVAGIGYIPGKTAMGWDDLTRSASQVMAHELGHNFGRAHSPCGGPSSPDPNYPASYTGGTIGVLGWDPSAGLRAAGLTDVMGYCNNQWISDYTYLGILNRLASGSPSLPYVAGAVQPSLLLWGRIENGAIVLEPTFEISGQPEPPVRGPNRVTATDADGNVLFSVAFAGERVADLPGEPEHFSFLVPLSALRGRQIAALTLSARGRTVRSVASTDVASDPSVEMTAVNSRGVRLRWDATRFPVVMVRDPVEGHVLSFARGGDATIVTGSSELELNFSNRVRSSRRLQNFK
jgi:hypothetical protein